mgnify:CR=1 FL=1
MIRPRHHRDLRDRLRWYSRRSGRGNDLYPQLVPGLRPDAVLSRHRSRVKHEPRDATRRLEGADFRECSCPLAGGVRNPWSTFAARSRRSYLLILLPDTRSGSSKSRQRAVEPSGLRRSPRSDRPLFLPPSMSATGMSPRHAPAIARLYPASLVCHPVEILKWRGLLVNPRPCHRYGGGFSLLTEAHPIGVKWR